MNTSKANSVHVPKLTTFYAIVFAGGTDDLLKLDLGFINSKFYKLNSETFRRAIKKLSKIDSQYKVNWQFFGDYQQRLGQYYNTAYVVMPMSYERESKSETTIAYIRAVLLLMFPSDFSIVGVLPFVFQIKHDRYTTGLGTQETYKVNDIRWHNPKFLSFGKSPISSINRFIKKYVNVSMKRPYISVTIQSYYNSFFQTEMRLCYLTLFIALESLTGASTEITYQISRMCAVLNSTTKEEGSALLSKVSTLYKIRSEIAHGGVVNPQVVKLCYFHLQMLASRTIIEVLSHNFKDLAALKKAINEHGFGQKIKLSSKYDRFTIVPEDIHLLLSPLPLSKKGKPLKEQK